MPRRRQPTLNDLDYVEIEDTWVHYSEAPEAPGARPPTDGEREAERAARDAALMAQISSRRKDRT